MHSSQSSPLMIALKSVLLLTIVPTQTYTKWGKHSNACVHGSMRERSRSIFNIFGVVFKRKLRIIRHLYAECEVDDQSCHHDVAIVTDRQWISTKFDRIDSSLPKNFEQTTFVRCWKTHGNINFRLCWQKYSMKRVFSKIAIVTFYGPTHLPDH